MNSDRNNSELAQIVFRAMSSRDLSIAEPFMSDDVILDFPGSGRIEGYRRVLIFIKALLRRYPGLTFTIKEVITDKDRACTAWTNKGTHLDGSPYENSGITLFHISGGKITFMSDYFKDTSFINES